MSEFMYLNCMLYTMGSVCNLHTYLIKDFKQFILYENGISIA